MDSRLFDALRLSLAVNQMLADPRPVDVATFKPGDTVSFTDKHLRGRIGTVTRSNAKS